MIGKTISHYKILEKLGGGGMGVVYKAEDTKLKRIVALKFLPADLTREEEAKDRFVHEAQAASSLDHPNICNIHEIDETVDGQMFIAIAYYEGETLKKKIDRGPMPLEETIDIGIQIAQGLARAHEEDIIHRDIKPANVMITNRGDIKIVDFGLAKLSGRTQLTKEGTTLGTVAYMSPQQAQGAAVDHRTDIWSLGALLYEMITGKQPFHADYEQAVLYSIMNEAPEPITGLRTGIPMELERIVTKCLEKDPSDRYQHADELIVDLHRLKKETKLKETLTKAGVSTKVTKKRVKTFVLPGVILVAAILTVIGYFSFFGKQAESAERIPIAVVDFVNETDEKELNGLSGMLITALEQSRRLSVLTRSSMFDILKRMGKEDAERIDEMLGREICKHANVDVMAIASIKKFARVYTVDLKLLDPEKNQYLFTAKEKGEGQQSVPDMIDKLAEKTRKGLKEKEEEIQAASQKVTEVTTINLEAYQHYFKGEELINKLKFEEAQKEFKRAISIDSTFGLAYYRLAYAISWQIGMEQLEKEQLQKALALIDRMPEKERYLVRAHQASLEKGYEAGIEILKEMEEIYPDDKEMLYDIGDLSFHAGQYATAVEYLERVLTMDPTFERAIQHLSWTYGMMGQFEKRLEVAKRYVKVVGSSDSFITLGLSYSFLGDFETALKALRKARELSPDNWRITKDIANVYTYQGKYDKAEAEFKTLLEEDQPPEAKRNAQWLLRDPYLYTGKYREALRALDKAIELHSLAGRTMPVSIIHIQKAIFMAQGWKDLHHSWEEAKKSFPFQDEMGGIWGSLYWIQFAYLSVLHGDYESAQSSIARVDKSSLRALGELATLQPAILSLIHSKKHKCAQAESFADIVFKATRGFARIAVLYPLAECQYEEGQFNKAVESLLHLQAVYENDWSYRAAYYPKSFYLLGKIYEKKGDKKLAIDNYEKFLDLWKDADKDLPDLIDAKARLTALKGTSFK